jgi:hypothetical protein
MINITYKVYEFNNFYSPEGKIQIELGSLFIEKDYTRKEDLYLDVSKKLNLLKIEEHKNLLIIEHINFNNENKSGVERIKSGEKIEQGKLF